MINMVSLLLLSIPVGFLGALTGLGGASILIPILVSLGIPVKEAIACGMVTLIATSSGSAASYVKERIANVKVGAYLGMYTTVGAIIGATVTTILSPVYLYFFFAAFLTTSFIRLAGPKSADSTHSQSPDRVSGWLDLRGSYYDEALQKTVSHQAHNALLGGAECCLPDWPPGCWE